MIQTIALSVPPSVNNLFCTTKQGSRTRSREYRNWIADNEHPVKLGLKPVQTYPVEVEIEIQAGRKGFPKNRDLANCEKAVIDLLVTQGILKDDAWPYVARNVQSVRETDAPHSFAVVTIREGKR